MGLMVDTNNLERFVRRGYNGAAPMQAEGRSW
jgi:hypothetical protein